jgi:hypothetical protein
VLVVRVASALGVALPGHRHTAPGGAPLPAPSGGAVAAQADDSLARAIARRAEDVPVTGRGAVVKLLADDREGSPHQRILVRVAGGGTVLIAHNLELAPRVAPLAVGDTLEFAGDFVWNEKGGVVHWTHPDPRGRHRAGWLRRAAR